MEHLQLAPNLKVDQTKVRKKGGKEFLIKAGKDEKEKLGNLLKSTRRRRGGGRRQEIPPRRVLLQCL